MLWVHLGIVVALWLSPFWLAAPVYLLIRILIGLVRRRRQRPRRTARRSLEFTREGKVLVAITLGVGVGAVNTGNNLLYLMLGMLLSLIIVSGILSEHTLRGLEVLRALPREVHAGRPFLTGISLHNRKQRIPSFSVQVEDVIDGRPLPKKCYFLKVPAGTVQHTSYRSELGRRGRYTYQGLRIGTRFPFAFFVKHRRFDAPAELLVLPRVHPVAALPLEARERLGAARRPRRGNGREFHGLRQWRPGDDARDVHWGRTAREARLVLREYEDEGRQRIGVVLNPWVPADEVGQEARLDGLVDLAASLLVHFADRGTDVSLDVGETRFRAGDDARGSGAALRHLALLAFQPWDPLVVAPTAPHREPGVTWLLVSHPDTMAAVPGRRFDHVFDRGVELATPVAEAPPEAAATEADAALAAPLAQALGEA